MRGKFNNIVETVGDTPVVRINRLAPNAINLWVKIEAFNPLGSVKDRLAMGMMMLSPMIVSLPFKLMLFVLVDGWNLIFGTLATSFGMGV